MATHSSVLAWEIPWTEESGRLQSMGTQPSTHTQVESACRLDAGMGEPKETQEVEEL